MKKQLTALLTTALLLTSLTGCTDENSSTADNSSVADTSNSVTSDSSSESENSTESKTTPETASAVTLSQNNSQSENPLVNLIKEDYDVSLPVLTASEALQMEKFDLPREINGYYVVYNELIDEKTYLVNLLKGNGAIVDYSESGLYDIESNTYRVLKGLPVEGYCAWNSDYIVYKVYNGDFLEIPEDESVKLYLYDIKAQESKLIYTYSFDRGIEVYGGHWKNGIALMDGKVYFDDMIVNENSECVSAFMLSYDIATGKLERLEDDAQNMIAYKDKLFYLKSTDGKFDIKSLNDDNFTLPLKNKSMQIVALENGFFSLDITSEDEVNHTRTFGIKNMQTDEYIFETANTIDRLTFGDEFIAFTDFGEDYASIVYNAKDNNFILFEELIGKDVVWNFHGNVGIIRDYYGTLAYRFTLK